MREGWMFMLKAMALTVMTAILIVYIRNFNRVLHGQTVEEFDRLNMKHDSIVEIKKQ